MASGVPTVYPIDLYTFMGFISIKEKDHAAAYAARAVYGRSKNGCTTMRNANFGFSRCPDKSNFRATPVFTLFSCNGMADG